MMLSIADPSMMNVINDRLNKDRANNANMSGNVSVSSGTSSGSGAAAQTFPMTLHHLLSDAGIHGFDDVVSWMPGGQAFRVHDSQRFAEEVMP